MSRSPALAVLLSALLLVVAAPLRAEEPPAPARGAPADDDAGSAEDSASEDGDSASSDDDASSEEGARLAAPGAAWATLGKELGEMPAAQRRSAQTTRAKAYLEAWRASGREVGDADRLPLAGFARAAGDQAFAGRTLLELLQSETAPATSRDAAANQLAGLLASTNQAEALPTELRTQALAGVMSWLDAHPGGERREARAALHGSIASILDAAGDDEAALAHRMKAAEDDPDRASATARYVVFGLMGSTHDLAGYPALKARVADLLARLNALQERAVEAAKASGDEAAIQRAQAGLARLANAGRPIEMLGEPADAWTLVRAYSGVEALGDLAGKVVVIDFWATWCPWCIRSFPALRDLRKDLGAKGLEIVGVTATSGSVYDARYALDDDLKQKAEAGARVLPVAVLDRGRPAPEGVEVLDAEAYAARELEVIQRFLENHEIPWPVVMIDKDEPGAKYGLTGWPHAIVLDRAGRVRYVKPGALLRDRPEQVAKFRKVLEDLLAEPAPPPVESPAGG